MAEAARDDLSGDDLDLVDERLEDANADPEALWDEMELESARDGAASDDDLAPGDEPGPGDDDAAATATDDGQGDESGPDDDAASAASNEDDAADAASEGNPGDIWANASPEQRAAFEAASNERARLEHQLRSDRGRISGLSRRVAELTRNGSFTTTAAAPGDKPGDGGEQKGAPDSGSLLESDGWKTTAKEYPEIAAMMGPVVESLESRLASVTERADRAEQQLQQSDEESFLSMTSEQEALLAQEHSDWYDVTNGNPRLFGAWLEEQPRHIQEAAHRNAQHVVDASEAADVVGRFKGFIAAEQARAADGGQAAGAAGKDGAVTQGASAEAGAGNRSRDARRQLQREGADSARGRGPSVSGGIPDDGDPEAIWNAMEAREERAARASR